MVCYIDINKTANLFFPLPRDFEGRWYMWDTFWYCLHPCRMLQPTRSSGGIDTTAMIMCSVLVWFPFNFILFEDEIAMQTGCKLFVCFVPLENFSLIWRRHHYRWRETLYSSLMAIEQWGFFKMCHAYCDTGKPFIMVTSEDPLHPHLLPRVWQWRCHFLF